MVYSFKKSKTRAFSLIELSIVILIIGILVAGVTQSSRLVREFKLSSARNLTKSSPVASIKDLAFWLESTSEESFDLSDQEDGLPIDNWYDINPQSISKINFTQSSSTLRPLFEVGGINNLPSLQFDGSDDRMTLAASQVLSDFTASDQMTIFTVQKHTVSSQANSFFLYKSSNGGIRVSSHFPFDGSSFMFDFSTCCTTGVSRIQPAYSSSYTNRVNIVMWRIKSGVATVRVNGTQLVNTAMTGTFLDSDLASPATFSISGIDTGGYILNGYLGEMIMFRRGLKADEISEIERYLSKKWGVSI
jgi:prepilin-type N-terminal cleavage/methylation domain-containing protein